MDMKINMFILFFRSCWWIWKKEWDNYEIEIIVIRKGRRSLLREVNRIYIYIYIIYLLLLFLKKEIVSLENEIVFSEIAFGMVHGPPYEGFQKNPPYTSFNYSSSLEFIFYRALSFNPRALTMPRVPISLG